jgi:hypothetical protein
MYGEYYRPRGVFNEFGRIMRSSKIFKARRQLTLDAEERTVVRTELQAGSVLSPDVDVYTPLDPNVGFQNMPTTPIANHPMECPPTLVFSPFDGAQADAQEAHASPEVPSSPYGPAYQNQQNPPRNSTPHEESTEGMATGGLQTECDAYLSPREVIATPDSSTDFGGTLIRSRTITAINRAMFIVSWLP